MLRASPIRASYNRRFTFLGRRHGKAFFMPKNQPYAKSPYAHKWSHEFTDTWDQRTGLDWDDRLRGKNLYKGWPWVNWKHDPVRHHAPLHSRALSAKDDKATVGMPEYNYYAETGHDYKMPDDTPLVYVAEFIAPHAAGAWSWECMQQHLTTLAERYPTVGAVAADSDALREWVALAGVVPLSFAEHVVMVCSDAVELNRRKAHRRREHRQGVLRTRDQQRYYALPPMVVGPAMPVKFEQTGGKAHEGDFTNNVGMHKHVHPVTVMDRKFGRAFMPP